MEPEQAQASDFIENMVAEAIVETNPSLTEEQMVQLTEVLSERVAILVCMELIAGMSEAQAAKVAEDIGSDADPKVLIGQLQKEMPDFTERIAAALVRAMGEMKKDLAGVAA